MQLAAHELHDLNELTLNYVNSITNMDYMLDHAYDLWQYMVTKGYYPLEPANPEMAAKIGSMY